MTRNTRVLLLLQYYITLSFKKCSKKKFKILNLNIINEELFNRFNSFKSKFPNTERNYKFLLDNYKDK